MACFRTAVLCHRTAVSCHRTAVSCHRTVLTCQRSTIVFCNLHTYKSARHASNNSNRNEKADSNEIEEREKTGNNVTEKREALGYLHKVKDLLNDQKSRLVDLTKSQGITVKHVRKETENSMLLRQCLEESPDKEGFIKAVDVYISKNKIRRGHIDFISTAMKFIEPYGLQKEVEIYEKLMDVFPRDKFVNRTLFDAIWPKMHPQVFLALDLLTKMEWQGILPTQTIHDIVYDVFGRASMPLKKIYRMWFWFEEFYDINPYKLPDEVYLDRVDIIRAAIDRILGNNDGTKILEISLPLEHDGIINYDHFIISSQTLLQKKYISFCNTANSIYIEGPTHIWINHKFEEYFIMKTGQEELMSTVQVTIDNDEEREGVVLGVCFATKPYDETLQKWLKYMQEENTLLQHVNIVFNIDDDEARVEKPKVLSG